MITFDKNNDPTGELFDNWRRKNGNWYVLNVRPGGNIMLHRPNCFHFEFKAYGLKGNLSKNTKYCSQSKQELEMLAQNRGVKNLKKCRTCL